MVLNGLNTGGIKTEANIIIDEQASIGRDLINDELCSIEDIEELMNDMGVEPDFLDEFLLRMC